METRLNRTGNKEGESIIIKHMIDYDGTQVSETGTYVSIDDKGYITYINSEGEKRYKIYKNCYRQ
jgi:hypothetical protein